MWYDSLLEKDLVPNFLIRAGIRKLLRQRLADENKGGAAAQKEHLLKLIQELI
jgi:cyclopropane-fatty-acyl-phospholipid synthase